MTVRYYQIGGVWNTYEYWHDNYGYTTSATFSVNYKKSTADHWGEAANPGYYDPAGSFSIFDWSFWADGIVGWYDINDLAVQGVYPAAAEDIVLERSGEVANAVYLTDDDGTFYLIDGHLSDGWRDWDALEADGWHVYEGEPSYIVVNESNGKIVHSIATSPMIVVITPSVTIQSFYFTSNGADETEDTPLETGTYLVYDASGNTIDDPDTVYDGSLAIYFTEENGNMTLADSEFLEYSDGRLRLNMDGNTRDAWSVQVIDPTVPDDDPSKPLTFKATTDGSSVTLNKIGSPLVSFEYSTDGGDTWLSYTIGLAVSLNTGDTVAFRTAADRTENQTSSKRIAFSMSGTIEAYHNTMSLLYHSDYENKVSLPIANALNGLFNSCASLVRAPLLPATTLTGYCYRNMFYGCTSLTQAPELPATTLGNSSCYAMFYGCTSLTQAPELHAVSVTQDGYREMFSGCSNLTVIKCHAKYFSVSSTANWTVGVSATGDFYADPNTTWSSGNSGIPSGWTRRDLT